MSFVFNRLFYQLHACQHGLSRAGKGSFLRLMLKFLYKLLVSCNLGQLSLIGLFLCLNVFHLLCTVIGVIARIPMQAAIFKLIYTSRNCIKKRPIMRHHDNCLGIVYQIILQPLDSFHVQVIGRLIQKQKIRLL